MQCFLTASLREFLPLADDEGGEEHPPELEQSHAGVVVDRLSTAARPSVVREELEYAACGANVRVEIEDDRSKIKTGARWETWP